MEKGGRRVAIAMLLNGNEPQNVFNNGTVSFVNVDGKKLILTNEHVWQEFLDCRESISTCRLVIGGTGLARPIDISESTVIDIDRDLDICVLEYPAERVEELEKEYCAVSLPPKRALVGDDVLFCGFPGNRTRVLAMQTPRSIEDHVFAHELILLSMHVESVSDRKLRMCFREDSPEIQTFSTNPIDDFVWGGMSGSLVYRMDSDIDKWVPCAISTRAYYELSIFQY